MKNISSCNLFFWCHLIYTAMVRVALTISFDEDLRIF